MEWRGKEKEEVRKKQVVLKNYVKDFEIVTTYIKLKGPKSIKDAVLLKNLHLSCDPYMRFRMSHTHNSPTFVSPFLLGEPIEGYGVAKVVDSTQPHYGKGDTLLLLHIRTSCSLFFSFFLISRDENIYIYVSAASGAVNQFVGQFAKLTGCYVVGSSRTQHKVELLKKKHNLISFVTNRLRMEGFIVFDYFHLYSKFLEMVLPNTKQGKIVYVEDIAEALESAPAALTGLFS